MGIRASKLAEAVVARGLKAEPWHEARSIALEAPEEIRPLAELLLERPPRNSVFFDALLSFLPPGEWKTLAELAVLRLRTDPANEIAESIVEYGSLQAAEALADEPETLFSVARYFRTYYGAYAWRGAPEEAVPFLERVLTHGDSEERLRAFRCLLQMRRPGALATAMAGSRSLGLDTGMLTAHLHEVGFEQRGGAFFRLFESAPLHLAFPPDYVGTLPAHTLRDLHPSWGGPAPGDGVRFGGRGSGNCSVCGQACHHLLTLEPVPACTAVSQLPRLELDTCLSCLGWSVPALWFRHDREGTPSALPSGERKEPEFPADPLGEVTARLVRLDDRWDWQAWGASNGRENLHRIGGHPTWVQSAEYPKCPECSSTMRFLLQLDSELDKGWLWGSGGILYVFWCDRCAISGQLWQCT
jgi:hypothetical protein